MREFYSGRQGERLIITVNSCIINKQSSLPARIDPPGYLNLVGDRAKRSAPQVALWRWSCSPRHAAGFGQREAARGAVDQALADARLEALQCLGHGRAGNAELAGGAGRKSGFGDFGEDRPALEIRKGMLVPKNGKRVFPFVLFLEYGSRTICLPSRP